jgi:hypothetical protein
MPQIRNSENADLICARVADNHTLREIAGELGCTASAITTWAREDDAFATQYARAMDLRVERWAEEILEISDDGTNDWMERQVGDGETITVADHEHIQRSKLRVDSRKWLMAKMMPKKYGDRVSAEGNRSRRQRPDPPGIRRPAKACAGHSGDHAGGKAEGRGAEGLGATLFYSRADTRYTPSLAAISRRSASSERA